MENKKINVLFCAVLIVFLGLTVVMIRNLKAKRDSDYKEYIAAIANIVNQKNDKIKILSNELAAEQRENADLKNTLTSTRNDLDALSKKLAQPAPVAAPASVPAPAAAVK